MFLRIGRKICFVVTAKDRDPPGISQFNLSLFCTHLTVTVTPLPVNVNFMICIVTAVCKVDTTPDMRRCSTI